MTSVSVAMATYNGARFISRQLDSIAAQTVLPAQLVVCDDNSTDETVEIVRLFARDAPFPVELHQNPKRLGYRANFMHAVGLCGADVVALCDQDDVWHPDKLKITLATFQDPDVLLCHHDAWLIDDKDARIGLASIYPMEPRVAPLSLFPLRNPFGFSMLFRRGLVQFSDFWDRSVDNMEPTNRMAHDQWFFFLASVFGATAYADMPLAGYRQHHGNTYGAAAPEPARWRRIGNWISGAARQYESFAAAADARASILESMRERLNPVWKAQADFAAISYRNLARHSSLRSQAYAATDPVSRLKVWADLLRAGGYARTTHWSFGRKAAFKDPLYLLLPKKLTQAMANKKPDNRGKAQGADIRIT